MDGAGFPSSAQWAGKIISFQPDNINITVRQCLKKLKISSFITIIAAYCIN